MLKTLELRALLVFILVHGLLVVSSVANAGTVSKNVSLTSDSLGLNKDEESLHVKTSYAPSFADNESYRLYGRLVFGYDNNVGAATDEDYAMYLPLTGKKFDVSAFNDEQLAAYNDLIANLRKYNKEYKSVYLYPQLGIAGKYKTSVKYDWFWDINASHKKYIEVNGYDIDQANLTLGANYQLAPSYLLSGTVYYQEYLVDGRRHREAPLGSISLSKVLNTNNILKIYTNDGLLIYPNSKYQNVGMYVGGLEWQCFNDSNLLVTQIFYGQNHPRGGGARYNGNSYYGANVSAAHRMFQNVSLVAGYIYQNSLYNEKEFVGASGRRSDIYNQLSAGVYYKFRPSLTWYVLGSYTNNHSNVFTYKYDRCEVLTGISFDLFLK